MVTNYLVATSLLGLLVLHPSHALAAPTQAQKCEGSKHIAAGKYAECRESAQKSLVLKGNQGAFDQKLGKCEEKFSNAWDKADAAAALAGTTCPDEPLPLASVEGVIAQLTGNLASALAGASLLSCTVNSRVLATEVSGCLPIDNSGGLGPCPGSPSGQDGALNKGLPHSYTDNGDGTITDNQTGLVWESLSNDGSIHDQANAYNWYDAFVVKIAGLNGASFAGHNDWRVPNINEIQTLRESYGIDFIFGSTCSPGCSLPNCSCPGGINAVWSSTSDPSGLFPSAWLLETDGVTESSGKPAMLNVRAVRGGGGPAQALRTGATLCDSGTGSLGACPGSPAGQDAALALGAAHSYTDDLDGTITDNSTGLMWESLSKDGSIHDADAGYVWADGFNKIDALNTSSFAGHSDWRSPNLNETLSLIDYRFTTPGLDPVFNAGCTAGCTQLTCNCPGNTFWTSTGEDGGYAWAVSNDGTVYFYGLTFTFNVRAVRDAF